MDPTHTGILPRMYNIQTLRRNRGGKGGGGGALTYSHKLPYYDVEGGFMISIVGFFPLKGFPEYTSDQF